MMTPLLMLEELTLNGAAELVDGETSTSRRACMRMGVTTRTVLN